MAKTGKPQTYNDAIDALADQSVIIPTKLLEKIDAAINANKQLGCTTRDQFIEDAVAAKLKTIMALRNEKTTKRV